ncbi:protein phosphatase 1 regulatory subunit 12A-like [Ruditapes philippinarum]|uniref:protein phosphatase 1 regulatory subunit 12A-like n=1 Tax=Ruditapes philippinarum TaxID=129788 RepID=UPI00295BA97C|nr:protein phosphatase 1 regulatory subunit 12A-like [Ruditapes philippinarum]
MAVKMQTITVLKAEEPVEAGNSDDDEVIPKMTSSHSAKRISFPVDSILNAVIQDGDVMELLHILRYQRSEFDLNQRNHTGLTALHYAVLTNNLDSVKLLLNHGANVSSQDEYGFSPLHTAAALGFLQVTTMLIVHGADVFSLTKHSELPIDLAKDISVIRVLSNEMCLKLQTEQYVKSLIFLAIRTTCAIMCKYFMYILKGIIFVMMYLFQKCCELKTKGKTKPVTRTKRNSIQNVGNNDIQSNDKETINKKHN